MANTKSAKKRARQTIRRSTRNTMARSQVKTAIKTARNALETNAADYKDSVQAAVSRLQKAANKGIIHHRNAARKISRLMSKASTLKTLVSNAVVATKAKAKTKAKATTTKKTAATKTRSTRAKA